jgi:hypothetical protein
MPPLLSLKNEKRGRIRDILKLGSFEDLFIGIPE